MRTLQKLRADTKTKEVQEDNDNEEMKNNHTGGLSIPAISSPICHQNPFLASRAENNPFFENRKRRNAKSWLAERLAAVHEFVDKTMDKLNIADIHRLSAHESNSYIPRLLDDYKRVSR